MKSLILSWMVLMAADPALMNKFSDIEIEDKFREYIEANALLMEVTGAKVIRLPDGRSLVLGVASTALKDMSAKERLRAERVCKIKALANIVAEKEGVQVAHTETLKEKTTVVIDHMREAGKSISEFTQLTKTKVEGIAKDMPVVGKWKSKKRDVYYLAIGSFVDQSGKP